MTWNFYIENHVGHLSVPMKDKLVSKEVFNEFFEIINGMILKSEESHITSPTKAPAFKYLFVTNKKMTQEDMENIIYTWLNALCQ